MQQLNSYIQQLKLRLTDLSQRNRSLKLLKLSPYRDFDMESISILNGKTSLEVIDSLIKNQAVPLIKHLAPQLREIIAGDIRLNRIYRTLQTIFEESGTYSLKLGFPFVSGKLLDETQVRCPLLFLPVRLVKAPNTRNRWGLEPNTTEEIQLNTVFFRAYEKANRHPLSPEFWETDFSAASDLQQILLLIHEVIAAQELSLQIDSQLFVKNPQPFLDWSQSQMETLPTGTLTVTPEIVLGIFPQADAAIDQDYSTILATIEAYSGHLGLPCQSPTEALGQHWPGILPQDSSQAEVLQKIRNGCSIAVNGPPGSGKSQLIVNVLTEALAIGKTVLVASQKRAALDVVMNRLQEIGIAPFCLCIHDYQNDKGAVYKQLAFQIAQIQQYGIDVRTLDQANWEANFLTICQRQQSRFDFHEKVYRELLAVQPCGLRLFDLYCLHPRPNSPVFLPKHLHSTTWSEWQYIREKTRLIAEFWPIPIQNNLWKNRKNIHNQVVSEILQAFQQAIACSQEQESLTQNLSSSITLNTSQAKSFLTETPPIAPETRTTVINYLRNNQQDIVNQAISKIPILQEIFSNLKKVSLLSLENPTKILDFLGHLETIDELQDSIFRIFKSSWHTSNGFVNQFLALFNLGEQHLGQLRQDALIVRESLCKIAALKKNPLFQHWPEIHQFGAWDLQLAEIQTIEKFWIWILFWEKETALRLKPEADFWGMLEQHARTILQIDTLQQRIADLLSPFLPAESLQDCLASSQKTAQLIEAQNFISQHSEPIQLIDSWIAESNPQEQLFLDWVLKNTENKPDALWLNSIEQTLNLIWIQEVEGKNPFLREASTSIWENLPQEVLKEDSNLRFLALELLKHRLKSRILQHLQYNQRNNLLTFRDLNHQSTKKSKVWPIRKLFQRFWEPEIRLLTPCVLASPETVSAIFEMQPKLFDLVIFDEASQCPVERAIPTFWRGKQVLVAGDEQQLPPYDLYQTKVELPEEEEESPDDKLVTAESLLQFAHGSLDSISLRGHYRSLFPELVAFSNQHFYDGRLQTISAANPNTSYYPPITYLKVAATWENHQNPTEATTILEQLPTLLRQYSDDSLGIITFNFTQQELILNELENYLSNVWSETEKQLVYNSLNKSNLGEKLLIKNIENIQGDERDIIIISTGYAPDKNGKLRYSFGSLSKLGGEKRLNVAITRARKKLILVTSLEEANFANYSGSALGVQLLGKFLGYAQNQSIQVTTNQGANSQNITSKVLDPIVTYLVAALQEKGVPVAQKVGISTLQVDLALMDPKESERYVLGIWVDGSSQFSRLNAQERILFQPHIFSRHQWNLLIVSARTFWQSPEQLTQKIFLLWETYSQNTQSAITQNKPDS